jgi:hypothetical protein
MEEDYGYEVDVSIKKNKLKGKVARREVVKVLVAKPIKATVKKKKPRADEVAQKIVNTSTKVENPNPGSG